MIRKELEIRMREKMHIDGLARLALIFMKLIQIQAIFKILEISQLKVIKKINYKLAFLMKKFSLMNYKRFKNINFSIKMHRNLIYRFCKIKMISRHNK